MIKQAIGGAKRMLKEIFLSAGEFYVETSEFFIIYIIFVLILGCGSFFIEPLHTIVLKLTARAIIIPLLVILGGETLFIVLLAILSIPLFFREDQQKK